MGLVLEGWLGLAAARKMGSCSCVVPCWLKHPSRLLLRAGIRAVVVLVLGMGLLVGTALRSWPVSLRLWGTSSPAGFEFLVLVWFVIFLLLLHMSLNVSGG